MSQSKTITEAVLLLRDENLVWSSDIEDIKLELAMLLEVSANNEMTKFIAEGLAKRIVNPGSTYNPNLELR